jgi:hypothetical protein
MMICPALRAIDGARKMLKQLMSGMQVFFMKILNAQGVIPRAQGLADTQQLEQRLLSRNPMNVPVMSGGYWTVYQTGAGPTERAPQTRGLIKNGRRSGARCS